MILKGNKFTRSAISAIITAAVLVAVLLLNLLVTFASDRFGWYVDMTEENYYYFTDISKKLLDGIDASENNITIYFFADPDELNDASVHGHKTGETNTWGMKYVYDMANVISGKYDFVNVKTLDLRKDAQFIQDEIRQLSGKSYNELSVVVDNYDEETGKHRYTSYKRDNFYAAYDDSTDIVAFRADYIFTSAILKVAGKMSTAYFIDGHGEKIGDGDDYGKAELLRALLEENGFNTVKINLENEDFPSAEKRAGESGIVVIFGPTSDYSGGFGEESDELKKLNSFLNEDTNTLMVFMDANTGKLPNLEEYLYDTWGIAYDDNIVTATVDSSNVTSSLSDDGKAFVGKYETSDASLGVVLTETLTASNAQPRVYFANARTISLRKDYTDSTETGFWNGNRMAYMRIGTAMLAPELAYSTYSNGNTDYYGLSLYNARREADYDRLLAEKKKTLTEQKYTEYYNNYVENNHDAMIKDGQTEEEIAESAKKYAENRINTLAGNYVDTVIANKVGGGALITLTREYHEYELGGWNEKFVMACGTTDLVSSEAFDAIYGNRELVSHTIAYLAKRDASGDASNASEADKKVITAYFKQYITLLDSESLDITETKANVWTAVSATVPSVLLITFGVIVLIRRRKHM